MASTLTGRYRTERDGGVAYSYNVSWSTVEDGILWNAEVRCDGTLKGTPHGTIAETHGFDIATLVKLLVEESIETRAGVQ